MLNSNMKHKILSEPLLKKVEEKIYYKIVYYTFYSFSW